MSRYIASLIIFTLIICGVFYSQHIISDTVSLVQSKIDNEIIKAETETFNGHSVIQAKKIWDDRRSIISAVIPHDKLDLIDEQFAVCTSWASSDEKDDYRAALYQLKAMINVTAQLDSPQPDRIF